MLKIENIKRKKISFSILAILILLLVLICSFVLFFQIKEYRNYKIITEKFYYYFASTKVDFSATIKMNSKDKIISVENEDLEIDKYPIYYKNSNKMLLSKNMEIVYPFRNKPLYKTGNYSEISNKNDYLYINYELGFGRLYDCFLYDGDDLYVFIEPITIIIDNVNYNLNPMSYIKVSSSSVGMYNKLEDKFLYFDNVKTHVKAYTEEYMINLSNDNYEYNNSTYSLMKNVDGLDFVEF